MPIDYKSRSFVILAVAALINLAATSAALNRLNGQVSIRFRFPDGEPFLIVQSASVPLTQFQYRSRILRDQQIQHELEIVDSQLIEIRQIFDDHFQTSRKLGQGTSGWSLEFANDPATRELAKRRQELEIQTVKRIDGALLPHQTERLKSVVCWIIASQYGLVSLGEQVAQQTGIRIPEGEEQALREVQEQFDKEFIEYCLAEYRELIAKTMEEFPCYRDYLTQVDKSASLTWLDILFASVGEIENLKPDLIHSRLPDLVKETRMFMCSPNGNFSLVEDDDPGAPLFMKLSNLLFYKSGDPGGLLTEEQKLEFGRFCQQTLFPRWQKIEKEFEERVAQGMKTEESAQVQNKEKARIDIETMTMLQDEILLPSQSEWLVHSLQTRKLKSYGILGILLIESAGDGSPVSPEERKRAREFLKKEIECLRENITSHFHETVQRQVSRLPDSIRRETTRLLGDAPQYLLPNLSMLGHRNSSVGKSTR